MKAVFILASLFGAAIAARSLAQDHPEHPKKEHQKQADEESAQARAIKATITGKNICLGCALKEEGAGAQCSVYGHRHALRVEKVTGASAAGKGKDKAKIPEMKGWYLHYLDTDKAKSLIKEHDGETLTLKGVVYSHERVIEVDELLHAEKSEHSDHPAKSEHPKK